LNKAEIPGPAEIQGKPLRCFFCEHDKFTQRRVLLTNAASTLIGLAWTGPQAKCYICHRCGYVHLFRAETKRARGAAPPAP